MEQDRPSFRTRMTDHLLVAVATTLGLFFVSDGIADGPYFKGQQVPAFEQAGSRYYVATVDPGGRSAIWWSDDDGQSWSGATPRIAALPDGAPTRQVCQIQQDRSAPAASGAFRLLVGVEPAALFSSRDGTTFDVVRGLFDHPDRPSWDADAESGLHTVLTHHARPERIIVVVGDGGVYRSDDGGRSWQPRNGGIAMRPGDERDGPSRQVNKVAFDASSPDSLFAQTNTGTYHSDNAGDSWTRVGRSGEAGGLETDFGFPVVGHPVEPGTAYVFPLESESYPCNPGGRPRVYRTSDGGASWEGLGAGLPAENNHLTVLRDALAIGGASPYPLVFGTTVGQLFASVDQGDEWRLVASGLPPVLCVRVLD